MTKLPDFSNVKRYLVRDELLCIHGIIADWCHECKHKDHKSVRVVLHQENLKFVENLDTWPIVNRRRTI